MRMNSSQYSVRIELLSLNNEDKELLGCKEATRTRVAVFGAFLVRLSDALQVLTRGKQRRGPIENRLDAPVHDFRAQNVLGA